MKRFLLICLAALMVLAAGCSNLIDTPEAAVKSQPGTGRALISLGAGQARTLLPDVAAFHYTLTFMAVDKTTVKESIAVGDSLSKTVTLEAATWTLLVAGFIDEDAAATPANALVKGNADNIVVQDDGWASVMVNLEPTAAAMMETGEGSLSYIITFPASLFTDKENNKAVLAYSKLGSTEPDPEPVDLISGAAPADTTETYRASGRIPLDAGYYLTQVYLYDHANGKEAALTRVAHIYNGADTVIDHDLSNLPSDAPLVNFDTRGGDMVEFLYVPRGGTVPRPADPGRDGDTFGGWYKEANCTTPWNFADAADADVVTTNTTLYAKWMSSAKAITGFSFTNPAATGHIDDTAKTIDVTVPYGTDLSSLVPTITVSPGATATPASEEVQDFSSPVYYTVRAENGSTVKYTVTVTRKGQGTIVLKTWIDQDGTLTVGLPDEAIVINRSERESLTVTAASDLSDIRWSLGGRDIPGSRGTAGSITITAANYPAGKYLLGLAAKRDGRDYSTVISFTVVE